MKSHSHECRRKCCQTTDKIRIMKNRNCYHDLFQRNLCCRLKMQLHFLFRQMEALLFASRHLLTDSILQDRPSIVPGYFPFLYNLLSQWKNQLDFCGQQQKIMSPSAPMNCLPDHTHTTE